MIPVHLSRRLVLPIAVVYGVFLLSVPKAAARGFAAGLSLCAESVLPALFPFFVVSSLIVQAPGSRLLARPLLPLTRSCGLRSHDAPLLLLLSWIGGYAVCARLLGDALRQKRFSPREAQVLLVLGCCSSPGFVIGCVGGLMLGNLRLGILLYFLQLSANLLAAAVLWAKIRPDVDCLSQAAQRPESVPPSLPGAISGAMDSCLAVCGCVLFFRVTAEALGTVFSLHGAAFAGICGSLEITSGCYAFAGLGGTAALYGICCCLSGLGASVFAQIRQLGGESLPMGTFLLSRLLHGLLLCAGVRLCTAVLPGTVSVYSSLASRVIVSSRLPWDSALLLFCTVCTALYKIYGKNYNCK